MICPRCTQESNTASRVCPACGAYMGEEPEVIVPGDAVPVYDDSDYRRPQPRQAAKPKTSRRSKVRRKRKPENYHRFMINWARVGLISLVLLFVGAVGSYVFLKVTPQGQLVLARLGREASADAYWAYGTELIDQGYISRSIATYEKALAQEPEHPQLVDKLLLLGEAYEAGGRAAVLLPNPFYQVYAVAAAAVSAEAVFVPATAATGNLPDYGALPAALLDRTAIAYLCSPANPQGAVAGEQR